MPDVEENSPPGFEFDLPESVSIPPFSWGNSATQHVLYVLYGFTKPFYPARGADIAYAIERNFDDPPAERTVYRALSLLEDRGLIKRFDNDRYILTEEALEILD